MGYSALAQIEGGAEQWLVPNPNGFKTNLPSSHLLFWDSFTSSMYEIAFPSNKDLRYN